MNQVEAAHFEGFPVEALDFFAGLEADNSKSYWTANRATYETCVKAPMEALLATVDARFRPLRMFRPYRDVRFSPDKSPYKTHAGAVGHRPGGAVYYLHLSWTGLFAAAGYYHMAPDQLSRYRAVVDDSLHGARLDKIVAELSERGYELGAVDSLKGAPRGYPKDHPRLDLLRRKGLAMMKDLGLDSWLHTEAARQRVEEVWAAADDLNGWLEANVGPSTEPHERARR